MYATITERRNNVKKIVKKMTYLAAVEEIAAVVVEYDDLNAESTIFIRIAN